MLFVCVNMLFTHAFCICFHSIMLFITLFFRCVMKYEYERGCGENEGCALLSVYIRRGSARMRGAKKEVKREKGGEKGEK